MYRVSNSRGLEYNLLTYIRIRIHRNQATTYFMPEFLTKRFFSQKQLSLKLHAVIRPFREEQRLVKFPVVQ